MVQQLVRDRLQIIMSKNVKGLVGGCGSESHMLAQCPNPNKSKIEVNKTVKAKVNACTVQSSSSLSRHNFIVATDGKCEVKRDGCTATTATDGLVNQVPVSDDGGAMVTDAAAGSLSRSSVIGPSDLECVVRSSVGDDVNIVRAAGCSTVNEIQLTPLNYVDVFMNGQRLKALIDSGCECPLVDSKALVGDPVSTIGNIWIQPIVGPAVPVKLAALLDVAQFMTECTPVSNEGMPLHLVFAVVDNLVGHEVVLPTSIADELQRTSQHCNALLCANAASVLMVQPVIDETHCVDGEVTDNCVNNADSTVSSIASCEPVTETELQTDSHTAVATELWAYLQTVKHLPLSRLMTHR